MRWLFLLAVALLGLPSLGSTNALPDAAQQALNSPESVVLYSLEPYSENPDADRRWKGAKFHGYNCLGQMTLTGAKERIAISEFEKAISKETGPTPECFDPRHALRVDSGGHTYDFLLCFQCAQMEVCEDEKELANLSASGSAGILNKILKEAGIPISYVFSDAYIKEQKVEQEKTDADWKRWIAATPNSLRPFFTNSASAGITFGNNPEIELAKQIPNEDKRIRTLIGWYGAGAEPWSRFPSYEEMPEELLLRYPTAKILRVVEAQPLSETELEGASRFFGGWEFSQQRPNDLKLPPAKLKKELLEHTLKSTDSDKVDCAKQAFQ